MPDQAADLRQLAMRRGRIRRSRAERPALLAVAGGKGGVGTTSVALSVAHALAQADHRVLFVDADAGNGDAALLHGLDPRDTLADALAGRRTLAEAACVGPDSLRIVAAAHGWHERFRMPTAAAQRLLRLTREVRSEVDLVVLDVGNALIGPMPHLCGHADGLLLVTTSEMAAMTGALGVVKKLASVANRALPPVELLVNMASSATVAAEVCDRLAWASHRLLGVELRPAGHILATRPGAMLSCGACRGWKLGGMSCAIDTLRLNPPTRTVDMTRRVFVSDAVSKWRGHGRLDVRQTNRGALSAVHNGAVSGGLANAKPAPGGTPASSWTHTEMEI
ncbi:MAG: AAA family ATPase [Thermoguttaceae bacterium]